MSPKRIDPTGCGCTDCGQGGYSQPYDGSDEQVLALLHGTVQDATYGGWKTSTDTKAVLHREWLAGRMIYRAEAANEVEAVIADAANYDSDGRFRPTVLIHLIRTLRTAAPKDQS